VDPILLEPFPVCPIEDFEEGAEEPIRDDRTEYREPEVWHHVPKLYVRFIVPRANGGEVGYVGLRERGSCIVGHIWCLYGCWWSEANAHATYQVMPAGNTEPGTRSWEATLRLREVRTRIVPDEILTCPVPRRRQCHPFRHRLRHALCQSTTEVKTTRLEKLEIYLPIRSTPVEGLLMTEKLGHYGKRSD